MIFIGGMIGSIYGFKAYMQITEGETSDQIMMRGDEGRLGTLPFKVRCDDFQVDYYPGGQRPKDFYSKLTVIEGEGRRATSASRSIPRCSTTASGSTSRASATPGAGSRS